MKVLLLTPPLLQPNAPYAALPAIAGFLRERGVEAVQEDLSLKLLLALFSERGMDALSRAAHRRNHPAAAFFRDHEEEYRSWVAPAVSFLQGRFPELAWSLAREGTLPEGPHFRELHPEEDGDTDWEAEFFGSQGVTDRAKLRASLFLDDVADLFRELVDPDFGFSRYGEHLATAAPSFGPILRRLRARRPMFVDGLIDELAADALHRHAPTHVGLTAPFPGTVYGAFRIAQAIRKAAAADGIDAPRLVLGGGYVNSELRQCEDVRVLDFFDDVCFDEGTAPWLGILGLGPRTRTWSRGDGTAAEALAESGGACPCAGPGAEPYRVVPSDYTGLDLGAYFSLAETANPMHRLWSDGRWLKVQLANGCYWHRCAFCDVALDYIGQYRAPDPVQAVDALAAMRDATGLGAFHFTDEALSPALVRGLCSELLRRRERFVWWGNIRLDGGFDAPLAETMARTGCVAVTAGLECANDRLLKLMRKGITIASARRVCRTFARNGILVHLYLMYGFPTETEEETVGALETVRSLFAEGLVQSAFWHRFALTVHSPIGRSPESFGIEPLPLPDPGGPRFALNEIPYADPSAPDLDRLGCGLHAATYNYMRGQGLDVPVAQWFS